MNTSISIEKKIIPIAFVTDQNFLMQIGIVIYALATKKNPNTTYDIYVLMADCPNGSGNPLLALANEDVHINIIETTLNDVSDINQIAHISTAGLLKFKICDLIPQYDKIIYLDGDLLVRGDLSDFFDTSLDDNYMAGVADLESLFEDKKYINSGVLVLNAKKIRDEHLSEKLFETRRSLGNRRSMDQQTFNIVMEGKLLFLPCKFNCISTKLLGYERKSHPIEKVNALYNTNYSSNQTLAEDALIIHFATSQKPWNQSFIPYADEWYNDYLSSPYGNTKLKRDNALSAHLKGFFSNLKNQGLKGVFLRIFDYIKLSFGHNDKSNWG